MILSALELENFRNYESLHLEANPKINVLFGENGQGKTSIIEAIYMCSCARSHRTSKDKEIIKHGEDNYQIRLKYFNAYDGKINYDFERELGLAYGYFQGKSGRQRIVSQDGAKFDKISDFVGKFNAVIFAPEDLQLVKSGPAARRRFLDLLLSQIKTSYFINLQEYSRVLKQRNKLLKQFKEQKKFNLNEFEAMQLDSWDQQLCQYSVAIISERLQLLDEIKDYAKDIHEYISSGTEFLSFEYKTNTGIKKEMNANEMYNALQTRLKNKRSADIALGYTSLGPHRDDFDILLNDFSLRNYGSQGQQRTAVLALKMSELKVIEAYTKQKPVLLLDDVMSELDFTRRDKLIKSLSDTQIFITCTNPEQLDLDWYENSAKDGISYYKVDSGHVAKVWV